jgi:hypothetical protein
MNEQRENLYSSTFKTKCSTALDIVREFGWIKFAGEIIPWHFVRRYRLYSESLHTTNVGSPAQIPVCVEILAEEAIHSLMEIRPHYYQLPLLQKRLKEGHFCFVARTGDTPIYISWMFVRSIYVPYLRKTLLLSPGEVYIDETYTVPEFRRLGVFSYGGYLARLKLRELGYERCSYAFASWQAINRRTSIRRKIDMVGEINIVNLPGFRKVSWKGSICEHGDGKISFIKS